MRTVAAVIVAIGLALPVYSYDVLDLRPMKAGAEATAEARRSRWDLLHAASALQGLVNRKRPQLYLLLVGDDAKFDRFWFQRLRSTWLKAPPNAETTDLLGLVRKHRKLLKGLVVWDERVPATSVLASSFAGIEDLLPVRYDPGPGSLYRELSKLLPVKRKLLNDDGSPLFDGAVTGSAKNDAYRWAAGELLKPGKANPRWIGYYPDSTWIAKPMGIPWERTLLSNHDFFIARKAFFLDVGPWLDEAPSDDPQQPVGTDGQTLRLILRRCYDLAKGRMIHVGGFTPWDQKYTAFTGHKHGDVETEWHFADVLSCFNAYMDADAPGLHAMANASFFAHEPLRPRYPQKRPSDASLRERGYLLADGSVSPRRYVTFYVGDYDSAAWLYQSLPEKWSDPARGSIPLGWAFNPSLSFRFPTGMVFARERATANDFFIAGDSGAGYLNPGNLEEPRQWSGLPSGLVEWERFNKALFRQWDLSIVGFVIDGFAPGMNDRTRAAYARFAPDGVVAQKTPPLSWVGATPFLQMGSDLDRHRIAEGIERVNGVVPREGLHFAIFRTILWNPSDHVEFFRALKAARPDVEIVDPFTLFRLAALARGQPRASSPGR